MRQGSSCSVAWIVLVGMPVGDEGAKALGPHLALLPLLQHLDIRANQVSEDGVKALAPHLALLASLHHLDLESNDVGAMVRKRWRLTLHSSFRCSMSMSCRIV